MGLKVTSFSINLPFGIGGVSVARTETQIRAAWALYVEFATRVATQPLEEGYGSAREALNSLHSLFEVTRTVLKSEGPSIAEGPDSVGPLAIRILNEGLRPFLGRWHTRLSAFETAQKISFQTQSPGSESIINESEWSDRADFFDALESLRLSLLSYVEALGMLAGLSESGGD